MGGTALHPSLEGRPFRCTGRFVQRFFLLATASQSVPTQLVAKSTRDITALAETNCEANYSPDPLGSFRSYNAFFCQRFSLFPTFFHRGVPCRTTVPYSLLYQPVQRDRFHRAASSTNLVPLSYRNANHTSHSANKLACHISQW